MKKQQRVALGSVSSGTLRSQDLIPAFAAELRRLRGALPRDLANEVRAFNAGKYDTDHGCDVDLVNDLIDYLNGYAPDYCYFGAHPGDGADFGFWLSEDWQDQARDDGVKFVSDLSDVSLLALVEDGASRMVCHVNDHGNATLYSIAPTGKVREVWSIV